MKCHRYDSLYPTMYRELEKSRKNLPYEVQKYNYHIEYLDMQHKYQKGCKHCYVNNFPRLIESDGNKF